MMVLSAEGDGVAVDAAVAVAWGDKAAAALVKKSAIGRSGKARKASKPTAAAAMPRLPFALRCSGSVVRYCSPFMVGLYPLLCTSVLATLRCVRIPGTYDAPAARWVVASQPYLTCLGQEHLPAAVLAVASLVLFVLGFPLGTLAYLSWHQDKWKPKAFAAGSDDAEKLAVAGTRAPMGATLNGVVGCESVLRLVTAFYFRPISQRPLSP